MPDGRRHTARVVRLGRREWLCHHRIDGRPVFTDREPTLTRHRDLFDRVAQQTAIEA